MLLSNERNYCRQWSSSDQSRSSDQSSQSKTTGSAPAWKVVCTVAVAVLAAGRTGPAAPGSERADRLHLPHVRCTALPARCLRACMVHSAICHTTHVRTGFGREHRQRALTLDEQRLHERAVMTCLVSHHDVAIRSGVAAVQRVDRRAVNICNILLQTGRLRVLTCCGSCAVLNHLTNHGCLQQGAPGQRRQVTSARGWTCSKTVHGTASAVFTCSVVWSVFHRIT